MIEHTVKLKLIRYIFSFLFVLILAGINGSAWAEEEAVSGRELLSGCEHGAIKGQPNQFCMQYVFGLVQTVTMLQQHEPGDELFCINPNEITLQQVTESVTGWLRANDTRLNEAAYQLVSEALNSMYPCNTGPL